MSQRLRVPSDCADLAKLTLRWIASVEHARALVPQALLELLIGADGLRRPQRFRDLLSVCGYVIGAETAGEVPYLIQAQTALTALDTKSVVASAQSSEEIPALIHAAQLSVIKYFTDAQRA